MMVVYNGISFDVMTLEHMMYDVVYDDSQTDYLYTKVELLCTGVVNGQVSVRQVAGPPISYTNNGVFRRALRTAEAERLKPPGSLGPPPGGGSAVPDRDGPLRQEGASRDTASELGKDYDAQTMSSPLFSKDARNVEIIDKGPASANTSIRLVQTRLTDPRGQLFVFSGTGDEKGELLLQSPGWGAVCDAKGGPKPTHFGIISSFGDGETHFVQFGIETYIFDKDPGPLPYSFLRSNRFSMTHTVDQDSWLTMQVQGRAVFDMQELYRLSVSPDAIRSALMLPIPQGFVREQIVVRGDEDGGGLTYSFVDRQVPVSFPAGHYRSAMRIEAEHRQYVLCDTDVLGGALQSYNDVLNRQWTRDSREDHLRARAARDVEERAAKAFPGWHHLGRFGPR